MSIEESNRAAFFAGQEPVVIAPAADPAPVDVEVQYTIHSSLRIFERPIHDDRQEVSDLRL